MHGQMACIACWALHAAHHNSVSHAWMQGWTLGFTKEYHQSEHETPWLLTTLATRRRSTTEGLFLVGIMVFGRYGVWFSDKGRSIHKHATHPHTHTHARLSVHICMHKHVCTNIPQNTPHTHVHTCTRARAPHIHAHCCVIPLLEYVLLAHADTHPTLLRNQTASIHSMSST
jgi:hypothetical protein